MPALPPYLIEPIWQQFAALLPEREVNHPLGCLTIYSIQWLKRIRPAWYREDLVALLELLRQGEIKPIIAERFPLGEVARAHELLGRGSVMGKVVLLCNT